MKTIMMYQCEKCRKVYDSASQAMTCEAAHYGLTLEPANKKSSVFLKKISKIRFDILCITFKPPEMPALKVVI